MEIDSILTFNFMDVMNNCPYNENIHKCTEIYSSHDKDCLSTVCARKQAYYYNLLSRQLKAENEELKKQIKGEINATQKWYQEHTNEKFKAEKYKQCLDEIMDICKYACEHECSNDSNNCGVCSCLEQRIQRKIKEVKGNE